MRVPIEPSDEAPGEKKGNKERGDSGRGNKGQICSTDKTETDKRLGRPLTKYPAGGDGRREQFRSQKWMLGGSRISFPSNLKRA